YSFTAPFWLGVMLLAAAPTVLLAEELLAIIFLATIAGWLILLVLGIFSLASAYAKYLKFDRPIATVLASQVIALLMLLAILQMVDPVLVARLFQVFGA